MSLRMVDRPARQPLVHFGNAPDPVGTNNITTLTPIERASWSAAPWRRPTNVRLATESRASVGDFPSALFYPVTSRANPRRHFGEGSFPHRSIRAAVFRQAIEEVAPRPAPLPHVSFLSGPASQRIWSSHMFTLSYYLQ